MVSATNRNTFKIALLLSLLVFLNISFSRYPLASLLGVTLGALFWTEWFLSYFRSAYRIEMNELCSYPWKNTKAILMVKLCLFLHIKWHLSSSLKVQGRSETVVFMRERVKWLFHNFKNDFNSSEECRQEVRGRSKGEWHIGKQPGSDVNTDPLGLWDTRPMPSQVSHGDSQTFWLHPRPKKP